MMLIGARLLISHVLVTGTENQDQTDECGFLARARVNAVRESTCSSRGSVHDGILQEAELRCL